MKHLKKYKVFEAKQKFGLDEIFYTIMDCYQDLFDEFKYELPGHFKDRPGTYDVTLHARDFGSFNITENWLFGNNSKNGYRVRLNTSGYRTSLTKKGFHKGFDGIDNSKFIELMKECHETCMSVVGATSKLIGSYGDDFDIFYFTENPDFSRHKGVEMYGGTAIKELNIVGGYLECDCIRHDNIFNYYTDSHQIGGLFAINGGMGYQRPIGIISGHDCDPYGKCTPNTPIEQWVSVEWEKVCDKQGIKWGSKAHKVTTTQFMKILSDNQEIFKTYKVLPKVNKSRF